MKSIKVNIISIVFASIIVVGCVGLYIAHWIKDARREADTASHISKVSISQSSYEGYSDGTQVSIPNRRWDPVIQKDYPEIEHLDGVILFGDDEKKATLVNLKYEYDNIGWYELMEEMPDGMDFMACNDLAVFIHCMTGADYKDIWIELSYEEKIPGMYEADFPQYWDVTIAGEYYCYVTRADEYYILMMADGTYQYTYVETLANTWQPIQLPNVEEQT